MIDRSQTNLFGVTTIKEYLLLCEQAIEQLELHPADLLFGFAAFLLINHLPDWLQYKLTTEERTVLGLASTTAGDELKLQFEVQNSDLLLIRQVANGIKHLRAVHSTQQVEGYGKGPFGIGPYGQAYLLIDKGDQFDASNRWDVASDLARRSINWWQMRLQAVL